MASIERKVLRGNNCENRRKKIQTRQTNKQTDRLGQAKF